MENLPEEIVEKILVPIFRENPGDLYRWRVVSKLWKNIIDRCTTRLVTVWCKQCSDNIPEKYLDDIVHTRCREFASWQEYCSSRLPLPHIAQDICMALKKFPNLTHSKISVTEICSPPKATGRINTIVCYSLNDKYFAVQFCMEQKGVFKSIVRIYLINDPNHYIREYSLNLCGGLDFYATDNREFIVIQTRDIDSYAKKIYLAEFRVNNYLVPSNLPVDDDMKLVITKNQCFIYNFYLNDSFEHYRITLDGFERNTIIKLPQFNGCRKFSNIQICNSSLFVSVSLSEYSSSNKAGRKMAVYKYRITRQPNGKLLFTDPEIYQRKSIYAPQRLMIVADMFFGYLSTSYRTDWEINFGTDNVSLQNSICDLYPHHFLDWMLNFFKEKRVSSITIYTHHVLITCQEKIIVFRGTLHQLMVYAVENTYPGSKCTVIDLTSTKEIQSLYEAHTCILDNDSKPKFLTPIGEKAFTVDRIL